jgi:hypothetical protein
MFTSTENNRKRPRRSSNKETDDDENGGATNPAATIASSTRCIASKDVNATPVPVVCLTGFSQKEKEHYHKLIESLGGR